MCRDHHRRSYHRAVQLVLASRSPRRASLLRDAGYDIEVQPADVDECRRDDETARAHVARLAAEKASVVAARHPGRVVIGADTVVVVDGIVLGKPVDRTDAARMLELLAGRTHTVLTGVAVTRDEILLEAVEATNVTLAALDPSRIAWYLNTGESDDKAGSYAAQGVGSRFIERINGSYTNVVGLPIALVDRFVRQFGANSLGLAVR